MHFWSKYSESNVQSQTIAKHADPTPKANLNEKPPESQSHFKPPHPKPILEPTHEDQSPKPLMSANRWR
jgi:hypothetical protein